MKFNSTCLLDIGSWKAPRFAKWRSSVGLVLLSTACIVTSLPAQDSVGPYPIYRTIGPEEGLPYKTATAAIEHRDGTYWIGCPVGVQRYVLGAAPKLFRFGDSLASQSERWVHQFRSEGDSLFAYTAAEVFVFDAEADDWKKVIWRSNLENPSLKIRLDDEFVGVSQYCTNARQFPESLQRELPNVNLTNFLLYNESRGFISSANGLFEVRKDASGRWSSMSKQKPFGLEGIVVEGLGVDRSGNLLVATANYSLIVIHEMVLNGRWLSLPIGSEEGAWGMAFDQHERLWVSDRKGVCYADPGGTTQLRRDYSVNLLAGVSVNDLAFQQNTLFAGTSEGLFARSADEWSNLQLSSNGSDSNFIYRVKPKDEGGLTVYSAGVVYQSDKNHIWSTRTEYDGASSQFYDGIIAADGTHWIASVKGLLKADGSKGEVLDRVLPHTVEGGTAFPFLRILKAPTGVLYFVSLDGGLWQSIDGESITRVAGENQRVHTFYAAEVDNNSRVWLGTNNGLACYLADEDRWQYFDPGAGYPVTDHNQASSTVAPDGRLVFGGSEGVFLFHPDSMLAAVKSPSLAIVEVVLDDERQVIEWASESSISYAHDYRRLDLFFAMLGTIDTFGLVPEIRIIEQSDHWRALRGMRLDFDNLPYGEYSLETRVRNRLTGHVGLISKASILRLPPWYATWWARSLFALCVIGLVAMLWSRIYTLRLRRQLTQVELENRINAERVRIARDLHDNVGSTLTYLTTSLRRLKDQPPELNIQSNLGDLEELSQDTLWELRETIWAASHRQVSLGEFSERLASYLKRIRSVAEPAQLIASLPTESNLELPPGQGLYMFRIVQEALTNAIKYASAKQITVMLSQEPETLVLEISDDGKGFDESAMGYSSGVTSINDRAAEMRAEVSLQTALGKGTRWTVRFPTTQL